MRVEVADPAAVAGRAADVLTAAWPPPCLAYPADYLRWEFTAPGSPSPVVVEATDGGEPVGVAAAVPRRVRFEATERDISLVSFVAVRPGCQGRGVAAGLYDALLAAVRPAGAAVVTFALAGSGGQKAIEKAYPRAGFHLRPLGEYRVHAAAVAAGDPPTTVTVDVYHRLPNWPPDPAAVHDAPSAAGRAHRAANPRPRAVVVTRGPGGEVEGAASLVRTPIVTALGPAEVTAIDGLRLAAGAGPAVLKGLVEAAGRVWPAAAGRTTITASNVRGVDPAHLRAAGLRQTPTVYAGFVAAADPADPILRATVTDLPVV